MNIPNFLSVLRLLAIPLFVNLLIYHKFGWALTVFFLAGLTDALDGFLARVLKQKTRLGAIIDPTADKILLNTAFVALTLMKIMPGWLTVIVISRDLIIFLEWVLFRNFATQTDIELKPTITSKINTFCQVITVLIALFLNYNPTVYHQLEPWFIILTFVTAAFTISSGLHYIYLGIKLFE